MPGGWNSLSPTRFGYLTSLTNSGDDFAGAGATELPPGEQVLKQPASDQTAESHGHGRQAGQGAVLPDIQRSRHSGRGGGEHTEAHAKL